jgi:hypothetical protein
MLTAQVGHTGGVGVVDDGGAVGDATGSQLAYNFTADVAAGTGY